LSGQQGGEIGDPLDGAGGRVTGREVIAELVMELRASVEAAEQFEGEMRNLAAYAKALAQALDCIRSAGGNRSALCLCTAKCSCQAHVECDGNQTC